MQAPFPGKYAIKGSVLRAYLTALEKTPHAAATHKTLSTLNATAAGLMSDPPLPGTWVDAVALAYLIDALHRCAGEEAVFAVARQALEQQSIRSLKLMAQSILKVFATSPAFLLGHFGELLRTTSRGIVMEWTSLSERGGRMQVTHQTSVPLPAPSFLTTIPALEAIVELCGAKPRVTRPQILAGNVSRYVIEW